MKCMIELTPEGDLVEIPEESFHEAAATMGVAARDSDWETCYFAKEKDCEPFLLLRRKPEEKANEVEPDWLKMSAENYALLQGRINSADPVARPVLPGHFGAEAGPGATMLSDYMTIHPGTAFQIRLFSPETDSGVYVPVSRETFEKLEREIRTSKIADRLRILHQNRVGHNPTITLHMI